MKSKTKLYQLKGIKMWNVASLLAVVMILFGSGIEASEPTIATGMDITFEYKAAKNLLGAKLRIPHSGPITMGNPEVTYYGTKNLKTKKYSFEKMVVNRLQMKMSKVDPLSEEAQTLRTAIDNYEGGVFFQMNLAADKDRGWCNIS